MPQQLYHFPEAQAGASVTMNEQRSRLIQSTLRLQVVLVRQLRGREVNCVDVVLCVLMVPQLFVMMFNSTVVMRLVLDIDPTLFKNLLIVNGF